MKPFGSPNRPGTTPQRVPSPRSQRSAGMSTPASPAGGLSLAMDAFSKKRGLASLNTTAPADADGTGSGQPHPSPALSPLSSATPGSVRTPLSEALAISAVAPRRKVARHEAAVLAQEAQSDDSDDDGFAADAISGSGRVINGGWTIGVPPHMMTSGAMSLPQHGGLRDMFADGFQPGSVMEGAGRKLRGTDAMRMRNAVLRQTGFLEPEPDNMFADHTAVAGM